MANTSDFSYFKNDRIEFFYKLLEFLKRSEECKNEYNAIYQQSIDYYTQQELDSLPPGSSIDSDALKTIEANSKAEAEFIRDQCLTMLARELKLETTTTQLAYSDKNKTEVLFDDVIDQAAFMTNDHKKMRKFLIDWNSANKLPITKARSAVELGSLDDEELNEIIIGMGFPYPQAINIKSQKIALIYDLIRIYKHKGSPREFLVPLQVYFGFSDLAILEWWLYKNVNDQYVFRSKPLMNKKGMFDYIIEYSYDDFIVNNPYWQLTEEQLDLYYNDPNTRITLPSITSVISLYFSVDIKKIEASLSILQRKFKESYEFWVKRVLSPVSGNIFGFCKIGNEPPSEEDLSPGDTYIITNGSVGEWEGFENKIAIWKPGWDLSDPTTWELFSPINCPECWSTSWILYNCECSPAGCIPNEENEPDGYNGPLLNPGGLTDIQKELCDGTSSEEWYSWWMDTYGTTSSGPLEAYENLIINGEWSEDCECICDSTTGSVTASSPLVDSTGDWIILNPKLDDYFILMSDDESYNNSIIQFNKLNRWAYIKPEKNNVILFNESHRVYNGNEWVDLYNKLPETWITYGTKSDLNRNISLNRFSSTYSFMEVMLAIQYLFNSDSETYDKRQILFNDRKYVPFDVSTPKDDIDDVSIDTMGNIMERYNTLTYGKNSLNDFVSFRHKFSPSYKQVNNSKIYTEGGNSPKEFREEMLIDRFSEFTVEIDSSSTSPNIMFIDTTALEDEDYTDWDPTNELPPFPSEGDRFKATISKRTWIKNHIYEWSDSEWVDLTEDTKEGSSVFIRAMNPDFYEEIKNLNQIDDSMTLLRIMLDFEIFLDKTVNVSQLSLAHLVLGADLYGKLKDVIEFFKPMRVKVLELISSFKIDDPLGDSALVGDKNTFEFYKYIVEHGYFGFDQGLVKDICKTYLYLEPFTSKYYNDGILEFSNLLDILKSYIYEKPSEMIYQNGTKERNNPDAETHTRYDSHGGEYTNSDIPDYTEIDGGEITDGDLQDQVYNIIALYNELKFNDVLNVTTQEEWETNLSVDGGELGSYSEDDLFDELDGLDITGYLHQYVPSHEPWMMMDDKFFDKIFINMVDISKPENIFDVIMVKNDVEKSIQLSNNEEVEYSEAIYNTDLTMNLDDYIYYPYVLGEEIDRESSHISDLVLFDDNNDITLISNYETIGGQNLLLYSLLSGSINAVETVPEEGEEAIYTEINNYNHLVSLYPNDAADMVNEVVWY